MLWTWTLILFKLGFSIYSLNIQWHCGNFIISLPREFLDKKKYVSHNLHCWEYREVLFLWGYVLSWKDWKYYCKDSLKSFILVWLKETWPPPSLLVGFQPYKLTAQIFIKELRSYLRKYFFTNNQAVKAEILWNRAKINLWIYSVCTMYAQRPWVHM